MDNITDEKLAKMYLEGDSEALEELIKRYLDPIYGFVFKYVRNQAEAEDVTQEVFVKVWKNIDKFKTDQKFKSWIFTIAKNTAIDVFKKRRSIPFSALDKAEEDYKFADFLEDKVQLPLARIVQEERAQELNLAMENLTPAYRATLDLRYKDGLKFREIAELLRESVDTIKTRHRRALHNLKKYLSN